jgi:transposase
VKVRERIWVGIDVGKAHHHACAVDETGKVVFSKRLGNGQAEIEAVIARAGKAAGQVRWALDVTSGTAGPLLAVLRQAGAEMVHVPGRLVNRMAGAFAGEGKSDAKDASTIAETARLRGDLTVITDPDQLVMELQVLTARRENLMGDWVRGVNRLRDLLASIFPALEAAFDYSTRSALVLLTGFQTPAGIRDAGPVGLAEHLRTRGAWPKGIPVMVDKALAAAAAQTIALPTETTVAPLIARLAAHLLDLHREIKNLDKQITAAFGQHPHAPRITSVNGFGPILGAQLLADTGGDLLTAFGSSA